MKRTGAIAISLLAAVGIGFLLGRVTAPRPTASPGVPVVEPIAREFPVTRGDMATNDSLATDDESLEGMREMAERAIDWGADPDALVQGAMGQLSDEQLIALVTSLTDFERDELEDVHDMRAFVTRLAEIAMDGTLAPAENLPPDLAHVQFTTDVGPDNSALGPSSHFGPDAERIYAVFESDELGGHEVFAKWVRVEDGEVMLFGRYQIEPGDDYSYVWMGQPSAGWEPGSYRVDFFTSDEQLDLLASGSHTITR